MRTKPSSYFVLFPLKSPGLNFIINMYILTAMSVLIESEVFFPLRFGKRFSVVNVNEANRPVDKLEANEDDGDSFSGKYQQ